MAQAHIFRQAKSLFSTTLQTGISTGTADTITLGSVVGLPTSTEITLTFDRVDSGGTSTPTKVERITGVISGSTLTSYTRAIDGTTEQAHSAGAVIEYIFNADDWNDMINGILVEHEQDGTHDAAIAKLTTAQTFTNKTLTSPKIGTALGDTSGNEVIKFSAVVASAVNEIAVKPAITGVNPTLGVTGGDTNVGLDITNKGTGKIRFQNAGYYSIPQTAAPASGATVTCYLNKGNEHIYDLAAGGTNTFYPMYGTRGQKFIISLTQSATGSETVTWFSTIKWAGGSAPTLTTTASKRDTFGFVQTGAATWDGFVVGQNI